MVQVFIGDTEVVSNKTFTIKEEMLATSSVITPVSRLWQRWLVISTLEHGFCSI